jgi:hypothetical protein
MAAAQPAAQPDGAYPRLNAAMVNSGRFTGMIVSLMGRFVTGSSPSSADGTVAFQCADQGVLQLSVEHAELPIMDNLMTTATDDRPVFEVVGQVVDSNLVAVSVYIVTQVNVEFCVCFVHESIDAHVLRDRVDYRLGNVPCDWKLERTPTCAYIYYVRGGRGFLAR